MILEISNAGTSRRPVYPNSQPTQSLSLSYYY